MIMKKLILAFISIFFLGLLIGYIPTLASPSPGAPNPGHTASEIGGTSDAERTFNSTGKYTFLGNLDVRGGFIDILNLELSDNGGQPQISFYNTGNQKYSRLSRWTDRLELQTDDAFSITKTIGGTPSIWVDSANQRVGIKKSNPAYELDVAGTVSASKFRTRDQACPSGWTCEVNTWDIAAQSIRAYGDIIVSSGRGLKSETGDLVIDAHSTGFGTVKMYDDVSISGNLNVNGYVKIGGAKLTYASGSNPSCPSGYMFLSKHYYGSCGGSSAACRGPPYSVTCPPCTVDKWDTNPPSCTYQAAHGGDYCECSGTGGSCTVSDWTEVLCIGT
jgi:hypothetical protein